MLRLSTRLIGILPVAFAAPALLAPSKATVAKKQSMAAPRSALAEDADVATLRQWLNQPEGAIDLVLAKATIDRMVDPQVDVPGMLRQPDQWEAKVRARIPPGATNTLKIDLLISPLYKPGRFTPHHLNDACAHVIHTDAGRPTSSKWPADG